MPDEDLGNSTHPLSCGHLNAALVAILVCFIFSKDLVVFLEAPVAQQGVRFLQLSPGEFFFTTFKARTVLFDSVR